MQLNPIAARLGLAAGVALTPMCAAAEVTLTAWDVTDADFTILVDPDDYLVDTQGVYGQVGRKLRISDLTGELNTAPGPGTQPSRLTLRTEPYDGYDLHYYQMRVNYRFDYSLRDFDTNELIASDTADLAVLSTSRYIFTTQPEPAPATFDVNVGGGSWPDENAVIRGFSVVEPFKLHEIYSRLYASGDHPNDFTLTYGTGADTEWGGPTEGGPGEPSGGLYLSFGQGIQHGEALPGEMPFYYQYTGSVSLTPAIPEPETYALMALGLAGAALSRRLKRGRVAA